MVKENKTNRMITAALAVVIIVAAITILYVTLPQSEHKTTDDNQNNESATLLTVIYEDEQTNYTLEELKALESYTGSGRYIKEGAFPEIIIKGPYNHTGVTIMVILDQISNLSQNYSITVTASDDWTADYNLSQIQGNVDIYNESGNITGIGGVTTLLAYKEDGNYINESMGGPLRIVYVDDGKITLSGLWTKKVVTIEVVDL